ncbi:MAG: hypothetical protein ACJ75S_08685 [Solirubrobacterales bacterium]
MLKPGLCDHPKLWSQGRFITVVATANCHASQGDRGTGERRDQDFGEI